MHPRGGKRFRNDIEGLRAVAIVAVLLCHTGIAWLAGGYVGVDVFFVVSGFLITGLLLDELDCSGSISLPRFYGNRAKRILPLAALLLAAVSFLSLRLLSPLRGTEVAGDVVSSALYVVNWHFAAQSVDYFAQGAEPSPVLHLWSLSVEEQFYLVWPTLMLIAGRLGRRAGSLRGAVLATVAVLSAASLALGIAQTASQPAAAYFSTLDRAWELGLGAGLAALGAVRLPRPIAALLGWAGLGAIVYAVLAFSGTTAFPGLAALVPTLGAAAVILVGASTAGCRYAPAGLLSLPPVRYVGRISYSWYLWHWPALIFAAVLLGPLSPPAGLGVVLVSLVPTVLSHHLVEDPLRHWRTLVRLPYRGLALGTACMATAVLAGGLLVRLQPTLPTLPASQAKGAAALVDEPLPQRRAAALRPSALNAPGDLPKPIEAGCLAATSSTDPGPCLYGDPRANRTLVLFGDSHAMQHFPELQAIAKRNRWRLVVLTKRECTPALVPVRSLVERGPYPACEAWRRNALRRIEAIAPPAMVVVSGYGAAVAYGRGGEQLSGRENAEALQAGYVATLRRLEAAGLAVVVFRDTPEAPGNVPSCVSEHLGDLEKCLFPKPRRWARNFDFRAAREVPGTAFLDVSPEICPHDVCRAVIGNVIVYRDNAHLTATYARTLAPWLEPRLKRLASR